MNPKTQPQRSFNPQLLACATPGDDPQTAYDLTKEHLVSAMGQYLNQSPAERRRAGVMKDLGLSEAALVALPREERAAAQREIDRRLNGDGGQAADAWNAAAAPSGGRGSVAHLFASLLSFRQ